MVICSTVAICTGGATVLIGDLVLAALPTAIGDGIGFSLATQFTTVKGAVASFASAGAIESLKKGTEKGENVPKWLLVGAKDDPNEKEITYDCWKPVVHDMSREPSKGKLLNEIISHPNTLKATVTAGYNPDLPNIVIENIWGEVFEIEYLLLHTTNNIVGHAIQMY